MSGVVRGCFSERCDGKREVFAKYINVVQTVQGVELVYNNFCGTKGDRFESGCKDNWYFCGGQQKWQIHLLQGSCKVCGLLDPGPRATRLLGCCRLTIQLGPPCLLYPHGRVESQPSCRRCPKPPTVRVLSLQYRICKADRILLLTIRSTCRLHIGRIHSAVCTCCACKALPFPSPSSHASVYFPPAPAMPVRWLDWPAELSARIRPVAPTLFALAYSIPEASLRRTSVSISFNFLTGFVSRKCPQACQNYSIPENLTGTFTIQMKTIIFCFFFFAPTLCVNHPYALS